MREIPRHGGRIVTCAPRATFGSLESLAGFGDGLTLGLEQGLVTHIAQQITPSFLLLESGSAVLNEDGSKIKLQDRQLF